MLPNPALMYRHPWPFPPPPPSMFWQLMQEVTNEIILKQIADREALVAKLVEQREGKQGAQERRRAARRDRRAKQSVRAHTPDPTFATLQQLMQLDKEEANEVRDKGAVIQSWHSRGTVVV